VQPLGLPPPLALTDATSGSWTNTDTFKSWSERAKTALKVNLTHSLAGLNLPLSAFQVMDLLKELDHMFEEPLMLCDVKADHFGLSHRGRVKVVKMRKVIKLRHFCEGFGH